MLKFVVAFALISSMVLCGMKSTTIPDQSVNINLSDIEVGDVSFDLDDVSVEDFAASLREIRFDGSVDKNTINNANDQLVQLFHTKRSIVVPEPQVRDTKFLPQQNQEWP